MKGALYDERHGRGVAAVRSLFGDRRALYSHNRYRIESTAF
jgi:hypothetical protein